MKNILVVDDSALVRRLLCDIIGSDSRFRVVDLCHNGEQALSRLRSKKEKYDAMVLDVNMPKMDGIELLENMNKEQLMIPVIMSSSLTTDGAAITIRAIELGAVDFVTKPENISEANGALFKERIMTILEAVLFEDKKEEVKPVKLRTERVKKETPTPAFVGMYTGKRKLKGSGKLIALACSTGGPKSLHDVLPLLNAKMNAPMVLVQHMPKGFTDSLAQRLNGLSKIKVKEAAEGDILEKGVCYIAPGGKHMEIVPVSDNDGTKHVVRLNTEPAVNGLRPCANIMYKSLINSGFDEITCVVMTGMGADGTEGIKALEKEKKIHVISQDANSCVVYGMPRAIAEAGLSDEVVPLEKIAEAIINNVGVE